jgi:hypothetical protein
MIDLPSAGRALDALVVEKVMGWRVDYDSAHHWTECGASMDDLVFTASDSIFHGEQRISDVPHYSTDIAAAWLVVLLMVSRMGYDNIGFAWQGPLFKPEHHYLTREGYPLGTTCWFVRIEHDGYIKGVCADTPELAICRAALEVSLRNPAK